MDGPDCDIGAVSLRFDIRFGHLAASACTLLKESAAGQCTPGETTDEVS